jgi:hypothetical protein
MCLNIANMVADPGLESIDKQRPSKMTRQEVSEKSDPNCLCLLIIGDFIYDCTKWQINHPGKSNNNYKYYFTSEHGQISSNNYFFVCLYIMLAMRRITHNEQVDI